MNVVGLSGLEVGAFNSLSNFAGLKKKIIEKNRGDARLNPSTQGVEVRESFEVQGHLKYVANRPFFKTTKRKRREQALSRSRSHRDHALKFKER